MIENQPSPHKPPDLAATAGRVAGTTAILAALTLVGKGFGFFRELVVARAYGAGADLDAFLVAYAVPQMVSVIALYVSLNLFLPVYLAEHEKSPESAERLAAAFWGRATIALSAVTALLALLAPWMVGLLAPDLDPGLRRVAVDSLRLLALVVLLRGMEGKLRGLLNAHRRFVVPTVGTILVSLVVVAFVVAFSDSWGVMALTWGMVVGGLVPVLFMLPAAQRAAPGFFGTLRRSHPALRTVGRMLPWFVAIEAAALLLPLVDRSLASRFLAEGRISALAFARILYEAPFNLVALTLATALFPEFAVLHSRGDRAAFHRMVRRGVRAAVGIVLPAAVLFVVLREPVTRAVYERGAFDAEATRLTGAALWALAVSLPFLSAAVIATQAAYGAKQYRRIFWAKVAALAAKLAVSMLLIRSLGHVGLALGTSAFYVVLFVILVPPMAGGWRGLVPRPGVLAAGSVAAALVGWGFTRGFAALGADQGPAALGSQAVAWIAAGLTYLAICRWGRVDEVLWVERLALRKLGGRGEGGEGGPGAAGGPDETGGARP